MAKTKRKKSVQPVARESADLVAERLERLREIVPEAFTEGRLDCDRLREALGESEEGGPERYTFTWAGKRDAIQILQTPSRATLVPCREESVDFDTTQNVFIEADNLEALKLLYKSYFGRVKMIYIDPPYNTGNDFIYPDNFRDPLDAYLRLTGQKDAEGNVLSSNPETSGRYHSAWLSMMYPRLFLARQLLRDDGVIFVSIDDHEVHNLRMLMNEVFGEENMVAHVVWQKRYVSNVTAKFISDMHDHILMYARVREMVEIGRLQRTDDQEADYRNPDSDQRGPWRAQDLSASKPYAAGLFTITTPSGLAVKPPPGRYWRCNELQYSAWLRDGRIWFGKSGNGRPMLKAFLSEVQQGLTPNTWWSHDFAGHNKEATLEVKALFDEAAPFDTAKPVKLLRRMLELTTQGNDLILDFFSGSATTAHAVLSLNREDGGNRRFIMVQLPEPTENPDFPTIAAIGKERIRRVIKKMKDEPQAKLDLAERQTPEDLGFKVLRLAESHFRQWQDDAGADPVTQLETFADPLLDGWTPEGVIYEVALREGLGLNCRMEPLDGGPPETWRVTDPDTGQSFLICLAEKLDLASTRALALQQDDLFVARDCALTDETAANLALQCRLKTI